MKLCIVFAKQGTPNNDGRTLETRSKRDHPDPFEIQIGALVVLHRAALLSQNATTHDALIEIANDYRWYGQLLEQQSGKNAPWDRNSRNAVTPSELFLETADLIGHTRSIPRPSLGMDYRHFRLTARAEAKMRVSVQRLKMARSAAVVEVVQHPDQRWQILHAEVSAGRRRQGLATMLYDSIETILERSSAPLVADRGRLSILARARV